MNYNKKWSRYWILIRHMSLTFYYRSSVRSNLWSLTSIWTRLLTGSELLLDEFIEFPVLGESLQKQLCKPHSKIKNITIPPPTPIKMSIESAILSRFKNSFEIKSFPNEAKKSQFKITFFILEYYVTVQTFQFYNFGRTLNMSETDKIPRIEWIETVSH